MAQRDDLPLTGRQSLDRGHNRRIDWILGACCRCGLVCQRPGRGRVFPGGGDAIGRC
jgi:hypothetical protein